MPVCVECGWLPQVYFQLGSVYHVKIESRGTRIHQGNAIFVGQAEKYQAALDPVSQVGACQNGCPHRVWKWAQHGNMAFAQRAGRNIDEIVGAVSATQCGGSHTGQNRQVGKVRSRYGV